MPCVRHGQALRTSARYPEDSRDDICMFITAGPIKAVCGGEGCGKEGERVLLCFIRADVAGV